MFGFKKKIINLTRFDKAYKAGFITREEMLRLTIENLTKELNAEIKKNTPKTKK